MTKPIHISKIRISNVLGIDELELTPGAILNVISGKNGKGKTSILEAIKACLKGGHDATLLRAGAEEGEIVLELDDGRSIEKSIKPDKSVTNVRGLDGKKMTSPASVVSQMADLLSINPVEFLSAGSKQRTEILLQAMPIELDATKLLSLLPDMMAETAFDTSGHPLEVIARVAKAAYDERTGINRSEKDKTATMTQLQASLGGDKPAIDESRLTELEQFVDNSGAALQTQLNKIDARLSEYSTTRDVKISEATRIRDEAISAAHAAFSQSVAAARSEYDDVSAKAATAREQARQKHEAATVAQREELTTLRNEITLNAQQAQQRQMVQQFREEAFNLRKQSAALTKALEDIEAYKSSLIAQLPIDGLEVRDGEIYRHGVAFDRLNTAQKVLIAIEVAKLRAGQLPVVCCDGLELMDSETFGEFCKQAEDAGIQLFITRVSDGELEY
ncbi:DNA recombination/repair protein [Pararheinheimera phage vB_PsoM_KLER1-1]|nr:DNA recombination/repair protein [Pararheinheimera phage vB_PsoM_KLER1-1]